MEPSIPLSARRLNGRQQSFLDAFRMCAALCVLVCHACVFSGIPHGIDGQIFFVIGDLGVVMFFLLSGFLSAYTLESKDVDRNYSFSSFVRHKLKRILWEYVPALLFVAALDAISIRLNGANYRYYDDFNLKTFFGNLLFLQWTLPNRLPGVSILAFGSAKPLWTLSLEWYFYLIHGLLFLTIRNRSELRLRECAVLGYALLLPIEYLIGGRGGGLGFLFALGALGYYAFDRISNRTAMLLLPLGIVLALCYCALKMNAYSIYVFLFLWLVLCAGLRLLSGPTQKKRGRIAAWLSGSTFMLYMLHYSILDFVFCSDFLPSNEGKLAVGVLLSLLISGGMYELFGRRLARRF